MRGKEHECATPIFTAQQFKEGVGKETGNTGSSETNPTFPLIWSENTKYVITRLSAPGF